jgi:hypothetical protein
MATALVDSSDVLKYEGRRRAKVGTDRTVFQDKRLVGYVREYSDTQST